MKLNKLATRPLRRRTLRFALVAVLLPVLALVSAVALAQLAGSDFEIDADANLTVDGGAGFLDWVNVSEARLEDVQSGKNDDSLGQGTKEDTAAPAVVDGSIPPNKSDLKTFGVYQEENAYGKFMHLFWTRVQDPRGTTNMDFEFNQSTVPSANGVTPLRTAGDLLIVYELSKGGTVPEMFLFTWLDGSENPLLLCEASNRYPCWGDRTNLTEAGAAEGSINSSPIPGNESDGLVAPGEELDPRTFGEASIDLDFIFDETKCQSFGSAYLKSRSSDSFTAALKDFIAPLPVHISNCGTVIIRKETDPDGAPGSFGFDSTAVTDPATSGTFSLSDDGVQTIQNVVADGPYTVTEDDPTPASFDLTDIDCSASTGVTPIVDKTARQISFSMSVGGTVDCTFYNKIRRGNIIVKKQTDPTTSAQTFDFTTNYGDGFALGHGGANDSGPLLPTSLAGTYSVSEGAIEGWDLTSATCDDGSPPSAIDLAPGETVECTFVNTIQPGEIIVKKQTDPDTSMQTFDFTTNYGAGFTLGHGGSNDSGPLLPTSEAGFYSVSEADVAGWDLTSASCDDGSPPDEIDLGPGETVECTFVNTIQRGNIIVKKQTDPATSTQTFDFTTNYGAGFTLGHDGSNDSGDLLPSSEAGLYSVSEADVAGWDLTSATCDDGSPPDEIDLGPGETVECTFVNTIQRGNIIVKKQTDPATSTQTFDFATNYSDGFTLGHDESNDSGPLLPTSEAGTYSVSEAAVAGWDLTSATCDDGSLPSAIDLAPGETVECTFVNAPLYTVIVLVCRESDDTLYASDVDYNTETFRSLASGDVTVPAEWSGTHLELVQYLCGLDGARFEDLAADNAPPYTFDVTIPGTPY